MADYGFSDIECKIICAQIERRAKYREEFLRMRTDPYKNAMESGHVFDPALQRFMSMKACQYDTFHPNFKNAKFAILSLLPMVIYGYLVWDQRSRFLQDCSCGRIRYRDRIQKLV